MEVSARSVPGSQHPYEDRMLVDEKRGLFAVADGVTNSSHGSGAVAAELAIKLLKESFQDDVPAAIEKVHRAIFDRRKEDMTIGETTLTAVAVHDRTLQAGNVGDSPALLISGNELRSLAQEDKGLLGNITQVIGYPEAIEVHMTSVRLNNWDVVVVASDGVGHVLHAPLVQQLLGRPNVNDAADSIIAAAKAKRTGYDDDKSVILLKVLP